MDQRGNGACIALDPVTLLCTIYADRPQTCRDFNRGEPLCRQILQMKGTAEKFRNRSSRLAPRVQDESVITLAMADAARSSLPAGT